MLSTTCCWPEVRDEMLTCQSLDLVAVKCSQAHCPGLAFCWNSWHGHVDADVFQAWFILVWQASASTEAPRPSGVFLSSVLALAKIPEHIIAQPSFALRHGHARDIRWQHRVTVLMPKQDDHGRVFSPNGHGGRATASHSWSVQPTERGRATAAFDSKNTSHTWPGNFGNLAVQDHLCPRAKPHFSGATAGVPAGLMSRFAGLGQGERL